MKQEMSQAKREQLLAVLERIILREFQMETAEPVLYRVG